MSEKRNNNKEHELIPNCIIIEIYNPEKKLVFNKNDEISCLEILNNYNNENDTQ